MKRAGLAPLVVLVWLIFVVLGGVATSKVVGSSETCEKPVSLLLYSEYVPAMTAIEEQTLEQLLDKGVVKPAKDFDGEIVTREQTPGKITGSVRYGNGTVFTPFGMYFMGGAVDWTFTATRECAGGDWTVKVGRELGKIDPAPGYKATGGRYANPDA